MSPHIELAHHYWRELLKSSDFAIDMTCGNGHDTLLLSKLCATVFGFDIQKAALEQTRLRLGSTSHVQLFHQCHSQIDAIPRAPRLIVYNLGYLPGSDKTIVTQTASTAESLKNSLAMLAPGGAISITCYPGHEEGAKEEQMVLEWTKELPSSEWTICYHQWVNRPKAPSLFWIVKI